MAATNISAAGGDPQVTVSAGNLIRYRCQFFLVKPKGETWPETGDRLKLVHEVTFNMDHAATDTFSLGPAAALATLGFSWMIDMNLPGGVGGPLQYNAEVTIEQDGDEVMNWSDTGKLAGKQSIGDATKFVVE